MLLRGLFPNLKIILWICSRYKKNKCKEVLMGINEIVDYKIKMKINDIAGFNLYDNINLISSLPEELACAVIYKLLIYYCGTSYAEEIMVSRKKLLEISQITLVKLVKHTINSCNIDFRDWEYMLILQLASLVSEEFLVWAIKLPIDAMTIDSYLAVELRVYFSKLIQLEYNREIMIDIVYG
jgi:hypothetical protein